MALKLLIRLSRAGEFFKKHKYEVYVDGKSYGTVNYLTNKIELDVNEGKVIVEIKDLDGQKIKELNFKPGQSKIVSINPSITNGFEKGFGIGIAIIAFVVCLLIYPKLTAASFIPFIPICLSLIKDRKSNFELTESKFRV